MTQLEIPALSKARLKHYVKLHQKKFRDSEGLFLAEGLRAVRELSQNIPDEEMLVALLIREGEPEGKRFLRTHQGKVFSIVTWSVHNYRKPLPRREFLAYTVS